MRSNHSLKIDYPSPWLKINLIHRSDCFCNLTLAFGSWFQAEMYSDWRDLGELLPVHVVKWVVVW